MAIKNLIFDVDGTLWDSTSAVAKAWSAAYNSMFKSHIILKPKEIEKEFGKTMDVIMLDLFPNIDNDTRKILLNKCIDYEHDILEAEGGIFYPEIINTLQKLYASFNLYIVSNAQKGYIELVLNKGNISRLFKDYLCFGDTGLSKDATIKQLMTDNSLNPNETLYIGDIQGDQDASHKAGIKMIYAKYGFGNIENPDYTINIPKDLLKVLRLINNK